MSNKGEKTKSIIKDCAYQLFAQKGFRSVTMKDICEASGLSRGGLYRHYGSTTEVIKDIIEVSSMSGANDIWDKMKQGVNAGEILREVLEQLKQEMKASKDSLSLAIYEYASTEDQEFFERMNEQGRERWCSLIEYGINRGEFKKVDPTIVTSMIMYSYQGVRMWSRVIKDTEQAAEHIVQSIKNYLEVKYD